MPDPPRAPQLWTSDATSENLGVILEANGERMAWLSSEGGMFDTLAGRYSAGVPNLDTVLKAHSGDPERVNRVGRKPIFLKNPLLVIGMSPQPAVLEGLAGKPGFLGRGLLGRFIFLLPRSKLGFRTLKGERPAQAARDRYQNGLRAMLDWRASPDQEKPQDLEVVRLSAEAFQLWDQFAHEIERQMRPGAPFEFMTDWAGKAPGAAARVAGVFHGILHAYAKPWEESISADTMDRAISFMRLAAAHARAAYDLMGADPEIAGARKVWSWMERNRRRSFTVRDCWQAHKSFGKADALKATLSILEERGYIIVRQVKSDRGRPSEAVTVRPRIWAHTAENDND